MAFWKPQYGYVPLNPLLRLQVSESVRGEVAVERHVVWSAVAFPKRIGSVAVR